MLTEATSGVLGAMAKRMAAAYEAEGLESAVVTAWLATLPVLKK